MKDGFRVIDSDRHIMEPSDMYDRYMPKKFHGRVKITGPNQSNRYVDGKPVSDSNRRPDREVTDHGFIFASNQSWRETFAEAIATGFDPASNLRDMDKEGIDLSVLFPTMGLYVMWSSDIDPELSQAICRAQHLAREVLRHDTAAARRHALPLRTPPPSEFGYAGEARAGGYIGGPNKLAAHPGEPGLLHLRAARPGRTVCVHEGRRTSGDGRRPAKRLAATWPVSWSRCSRA